MDILKISQKLRLNNDLRCLIVNAPTEYTDLLDGIEYDTVPSEEKCYYDFIQIFAEKQTDLETLVIKVAEKGKYDCLFWACYPKMTGKIKSDIKRETVWKAFNLVELEPVTQIAIDETWSALRARPANATKRVAKK